MIYLQHATTDPRAKTSSRVWRLVFPSLAVLRLPLELEDYLLCADSMEFMNDFATQLTQTRKLEEQLPRRFLRFYYEFMVVSKIYGGRVYWDVKRLCLIYILFKK